MVSGLFHKPVDLVLFDRFMIPEVVRPWLASTARGVLLGLWDRSRALVCECGSDRVLRVEVFTSSVLQVRVSCYAHPLVMASASVELKRCAARS